jgi:glycosyltransferase involved in cell wall biosynthesis
VTDKLDIVMALNYYSPYVSGLTEASRLVAEELVRRGHRVTVVAAQHEKELPRDEMLAGVRVVRTPVALRIGKGVISPSFIPTVVRHAKSADVLNLHMPMLESGLIATLVRSTPVVATYQCDIALPDGLFNRIQSRAMDASNSRAMRASTAIVPSSLDYAKASRLQRRMSDARTLEISPPTRLLPTGQPRFRETDGLHVGFLGRLVEEKGIEYLVDGFRALDDPEARLIIAGDYSKIAGGSVIDRVREHIGSDDRIRVLGFVPDEDLADFYASLDVFALPSINSFEAFGIVQVEAMKLGVAALASDLPGVRIPVQRTGFGRVVRRRDAAAITSALRELAANPLDTTAGADAANREYGQERTTDEYEALFRRLAEGRAAAPREDDR